MPLTNVNANDVITVQVFGDNQQFKVINIELLLSDEVDGGDTLSKVIGKDTEIIVKNQDDSDYDSEV